MQSYAASKTNYPRKQFSFVKKGNQPSSLTIFKSLMLFDFGRQCFFARS